MTVALIVVAFVLTVQLEEQEAAASDR